MRKSCAPSSLAKLHKFDVDETKNPKEETESKAPRDGGDNFFENRAIFKVVWRDVTKKKNKAWKGDGIIIVYLTTRRASLKDIRGNYMGFATLRRQDVIEEGLQLEIGGKEVELVEQILTKNEYFTAIKKPVVDEENWGTKGHLTPMTEEMKKPKGSYVFRPSLHIEVPLLSSTMPSNSKRFKRGRPTEFCIPSRQFAVLRPHQIEGVNFLCNCLLGFSRAHLQHFGCILADEMGLGKTLQCLTAVLTLMRMPMSQALDSNGTDGGNVLKRVLIVTPSTLTANWNHEVTKWLLKDRLFAFVVGGKWKLSSYAQQRHIPFVIVSYDLLHKNYEEFKHVHFDLLICDEGHRLKNELTKTYILLNKLNIKRRLIITGTPVQNNLRELFAMADFVNPGILGTYRYFRENYELPIERGQAPERSLELNEIIGTFLLRRSQLINCQYLRKKQEYICLVRPSDLQQALLQKAFHLYETRSDEILKDLNPLQIINIVRKICNNPSLISGDVRSASNILTKNLEYMLPDLADMKTNDTAKMRLVEGLLYATCLEKREKCVLVSNYTKTLNALQGLCDYMKIKCVRLDGSTPCVERNRIVEQFNTPIETENDNEQPLVFLLSAKAGGVGLNLIGASRLILFDNDWNPATDAQAVARIWRDGQQHDVQIYRLVTAGCIEEKILQRQIAKVSLGEQVLQTSKAESADDDVMRFSHEQLLDLLNFQYDYDTCLTHDILKCDCDSNGENLFNKINNDDVEGEDDVANGSNNINELMLWQHYGPPFDRNLMAETDLKCVQNNIMYIFATQKGLE